MVNKCKKHDTMLIFVF